MLSIYSDDVHNFNGGTGIALGNFDGLHIGHMKLINETISMCKKYDLKSMVYTFNNHPLNVIFEGGQVSLITNNNKRKEILSCTGLDYLFLESFDEQLMQMEAEDFVKKILINKLNAKLIVVGFNYFFGYKGKGNRDLLHELGKKYNIKIKVIDSVKMGDIIVSSSLIREYIRDGKIEEATKFLNRNFSISGIVSKGKMMGSKLGFPTANIIPDIKMILPKRGTYITYTTINNNKYKSITNLGYNPTFEEKNITIETHIFNINETLYNKKIEVEFLKRLRDEKKFEDIEQLKQQIVKDKDYANLYFSKK